MSEEKYLLAMDAGTGSVRAVIFSTDGTQVGVVQKEIEELRRELRQAGRRVEAAFSQEEME